MKGDVSLFSTLIETSPSRNFISSFCFLDSDIKINYNHTISSKENDLPNTFWKQFAFQNLTPCVEEIIILGSMHIIMIICCIVRWYQLRNNNKKSQFVKLKRSIWIYLIILANFIAVLTPILQLNARLGQTSVFLSTNTTSLAPYEIVSFTITIIAWLCSTMITIHQYLIYTSIYGSWIMRFCWLFALSCETIKFYFNISLANESIRFYNYFFYLYIIQFTCILFLGCISLFYYPKVTSYVPKSFKNIKSSSSINENDIINDNENDTTYPLLLKETGKSVSVRTYNTIVTVLNLNKINKKKKNKNNIKFSQIESPEEKANFISWLLFSWINPILKLGYKKPLEMIDIWQLNDRDTTQTISKRFKFYWQYEKLNKKPSLNKALFRSFGFRYFIAGLYKLFSDAAQFTGPLFLKCIILFIGSNEISPYPGYLYALAIISFNIIGAIGEGQYIQMSTRVGLQSRSALIDLIFDHSLNLSLKSRQSTSIGTINNIMAQDTEAIQLAIGSLHILWSAPLRIILSLFFLYKQLGLAAFAGAILLAIAIPSQKQLILLQEKYTRLSLKKSDDRVQLSSEVLSSMNVVKMYAWEKSFLKNIQNVRNEELYLIRQTAITRAYLNFAINCVPVIVSVVALAIFSSIKGNILTPAIAFTSLALFDVLRYPLMLLPTVLNQLARYHVAVDRIQEFLLYETSSQNTSNYNSNNTTNNNINDIHDGIPAIHIQKGDFTWNGTDTVPYLSNINIKISKGSLISIIGKTGQGKSSFLSAILGDMIQIHNNNNISFIKKNGKIAYVPQQAWIFNGTIRENILFGNPYDEDNYYDALRYSCLITDIIKLPAADLTEIGERGANLSGGQRQRISIARAIYSNADIYLLDDVLSALDSHVAREIYENCINDYLKNKTRIFVTNRTEFLSNNNDNTTSNSTNKESILSENRILLFKEGKIIADGTFFHLLQHSKDFSALVSEGNNVQENNTNDTKSTNTNQTNVLNKDNLENSREVLVSTSSPVKLRSNTEIRACLQKAMENSGNNGSLTEAEAIERGEVNIKTMFVYINAMGGMWYFYIILLLYIAGEICRIGSSYWISLWSSNSLNLSVTTYIIIYGFWSIGQSLFILWSQLLMFIRGVLAGEKLHNDLFHTLLRAPMAFFNKTPLGRILNRITKDIGDIDRQMMFSISVFIRGVIQLLGTLVVIGCTTYYTLATFVPILFLFHSVQRYYQSSSRELKRLDAVTRSPIYNHFNSCLSGVSSIRAYNAQFQMISKIRELIDINTRAYLVGTSCNRWLTIHLEFLGALMILGSAAVAIKMRFLIGPHVAGLSLSYALQITGILNMTVRLATLAENSFNSVERLNEYIIVESEASENTSEDKQIIEYNNNNNNINNSWPQDGLIIFQDIKASYRKELQPILRGLTFTVQPKEKIGIVGRTGAGKSTVLLTLFRIIEPFSGTIFIDGVNILQLGLKTLRERLSIIPQEPILFSGTVRSNLDPSGIYSDILIWKALEKAHLKPYIQHSIKGLSMEITENGQQFSLGQRQLLCLARALLKKSKILVLDEATAAVDMETDSLIQDTIREEFADCTMLTIAHRLNTIIDSDKILVMENGIAKEYDKPEILLSNKKSIFSNMVDETGPQNSKFLKKIAFGEIVYRRTLQALAKKGKVKLMPTSQALSLFKREMSLSGFNNLHFENQQLDEIRNALMILRNSIENLSITNETSTFLKEANYSQEEWLQELKKMIHTLDISATKKLNQLANVSIAKPDDLAFIVKSCAKT